MGYTLIVAEKPELGRAIADAIDGYGKEQQGVINKGNYVITWCYGHLLTLKSPGEYDEKYNEWVKEDLPIYFRNWQRVPTVREAFDHRSKKMVTIDHRERVKQISKLIDKADCIIHAGDPDDEGEVLILELLEYCKNTKPIKRLLINDNTVASVKKALANMEPYNQKYINIAQSAYARAVADYIVGINYSRLYSLNLNKKGLSIGRVQSPTLGLVVNRDLAIKNHVKEKYYELYMDGELEQIRPRLKFKPNKETLQGETRIKEESVLQNIVQRYENTEQVLTIDKNIIYTHPPLVFNLLELQAYMNKQYKWKASKTDQVSQSLRDRHKAITYNRSDSQYLNDEHYTAAPDVLKKVMNRFEVNYPLDFSIKSKTFNAAYVTAHHGIIPTAQDFNLSNLSADEKLCYQVICERYMMQFLNPVKKEKTTGTVIIDAGELSASSTVILEKGFLEYFSMSKNENSEEEDEESVLSQMQKGNYKTLLKNPEIRTCETKPLKRYTEATLLKDMCGISKYVKDPEIKKILLRKDQGKKGEHGSIGTSATRSAIIVNLIRRGFLKEEKNNIVSTPLGQQFYQIMPDEMKTADLTAKWFLIQEQIKEGNATVDDMIDSVLQAFKPHLKEEFSGDLRDDFKTSTAAKEVVGTCPKCGGEVLLKYTKDKKLFYPCSNIDCDFALFEEMRHYDNKLKITKTRAKALLSKKGKAPFKLKSKAGKEYEAYLEIKINGKYVNFNQLEFVNAKKK